MLKVNVHPNLKIIRFDGSAENCAEIQRECDAEIVKNKKDYWFKKKCQVSPEDAAAGWAGGFMQLKIRIGDFITFGNALHILSPKEFSRFFIVE